MNAPLRLLAVLAHPDDETLGLGVTLARYAAEGVETYLVTATHGQSGRFRDRRPGDPGHPGPAGLAAIREAELHAADVGHAGGAPHAVPKFYFIAWPAQAWAAYQEAFKKLTATVDGVERQATPWPAWQLSARIDTRAWWPIVWQAVNCHDSQVANYAGLGALSPEHHEGLWGWQTFYRAWSTVNGGRATEDDLFAGLRPPPGAP